MAELVWSNKQSRYGIDRGVVYLRNAGYALNGLVNATMGYEDSAIDDLYFDGLKYNRSIVRSDYRVTLELFTIPNDILGCFGYKQLFPGYFVGNQIRMPFSMSFRVQTQNSYRIVLLYNLTADEIGFSTTTDGANPKGNTFKVSCTSKPVVHPKGLFTGLAIEKSNYDKPDFDYFEDRLYARNGYPWPSILMPDELVA